MFAETLREIATRLDNVDCILVMGMDGLPIEKIVLNEALNMDLVTAEFTTVLRIAAHSASEMGAGNVEEVIILADEMIILTKTIADGYFLMLIVPQDANIGKARFELKKAKYILEKEFV
jgi:predicted regulator of Ras-like GTPase activity (Roadblock/LC7/MglB family)